MRWGGVSVCVSIHSCVCVCVCLALWWNAKGLASFSADRHRQVITWERASLLTVKGYWAHRSLGWQIAPSIHPVGGLQAPWVKSRPASEYTHICKPREHKCHKSTNECQCFRLSETGWTCASVWTGCNSHTYPTYTCMSACTLYDGKLECFNIYTHMMQTSTMVFWGKMPFSLHCMPLIHSIPFYFK